MTLLWIALGAAVGAPARYLTDRAITGLTPGRFPLGTTTVNLIASFVLGLLAGLGSHVAPAAGLVLGTGLCGALSTFSTFGYETLRLSREGAGRLAVANVAASVLAGVALAALGWWLGLTVT